MLMRCMGKTQETEPKVKLLLNIHFILTCILYVLYQLALLLCNSGGSLLILEVSYVTVILDTSVMKYCERFIRGRGVLNFPMLLIVLNCFRIFCIVK
jgi:hypothetical protein